MRWVKKYCLLLLVCVSVLVFTQDTTTTQYLSIRSKLIELKKESEHVTEQLRIVSESLTISQQRAKEWEETSKTLSESLMSINQQYNDCYEQLVTEKTKNRNLLKLNCALFVILVIRIMCMIAGYILYAKGVKLPRWLDILL